jgi:hypothetical protein
MISLLPDVRQRTDRSNFVKAEWGKVVEIVRVFLKYRTLDG